MWCGAALAALSVAVLAAGPAGAALPGTPPGVPLSTDCALRAATWQVARRRVPRKGSFEALHDALVLGRCEQHGVPMRATPQPLANVNAHVRRALSHRGAAPAPGAAVVVYADAVAGSDAAGNGSFASPFKTLEAALTDVRRRRQGAASGGCATGTERRDGAEGIDRARAHSDAPRRQPPLERAAIVLRAGVYFLGAPVQLGPADSNLTITRWRDEVAVVSGGVPLDKLEWRLLPPGDPSPHQERDRGENQPGRQHGQQQHGHESTHEHRDVHRHHGSDAQHSRLRGRQVQQQHASSPRADGWTLFNNSNNVFGQVRPRADAPCCKFVGSTPTVEACESAMAASPKGPFQSFTWHPLSAGAFAGDCYGVVTDLWAPHEQQGYVSGRHGPAPPSPPPPVPPPPPPPLRIAAAELVGANGKAALDATGLRINGSRAVRARFPNVASIEGQPYSPNGPLDGYIRARTSWVPPRPPPQNATVEVVGAADWPSVHWPMNTSDVDPTVPGVPPSQTGAGDQGSFVIGVGGPCAGDVLPGYGYSCSPNGGPRGAGQHRHPAGLASVDNLPHAPYRNATGAVVHAWRPDHWFTVQYEVGGGGGGGGGGTGLNFTRGGFQGAEGFTANAEWWLENVREELDAPGEFFIDRDASELLYITNTTGSPLPGASDTFVATRHKVLFNLTGTAEAPVEGVTLSGLVLRDTRESFLDPHGLPSGGDWALPYIAAVTADGTVGTNVTGCVFTQLDGIGVALLGRNRAAAVVDNDFEFLGGSAVVLWGRTDRRLNENGTRSLPSAFHPNGPDGRALDVPLDTLIEGNVAHDIGLWQKQSSLLFQAVSARTTLRNNVAYNLPRAAVNLNDDFGGGDVIDGNVLANAVRESGDHGPINSWSRLPYVTTIRNGTASILPAARTVTGNLIVGSYSSQECIDNDDGSAWYNTTGNVLVYGNYGMKSDFGGWQNHHTRNLYAYVCSCYGEGADDVFANNTCVVRDGGGCPFWPPYASDAATPHGPPAPNFRVGGNTVRTSTGNVTVGPHRNVSLAAWVASGHDRGTVVTTLPSDAELVRTVKAWLGD